MNTVNYKGWMVFPVVALLATGCATLDYSKKNQDGFSMAESGNYAGALAVYEESSKSLTGGRSDELLYFLETGELMRLQRNIEAATERWNKADEKFEEWESESRINLASGMRGIASATVSDSLRRYDGQDYEKTALSARLALNFLAKGDYKTARIKISNVAERELLIEELRAKEVAAAEDAAKEKGAKVIPITELKGYPHEVFDDPEVKKLRNGYQSAFAWYLTGFVHEALREPSLATPAYQKAIQIRPDVPFLKQALDGVKSTDSGKENGVGGRLGRSSGKPRATEQAVVKASEGLSDTLLVVESGWIPARQSVNISLPLPINHSARIITTSFPVMHPRKGVVMPSSAVIDGKVVNLSEVTNYDAMARRALSDEMPGVIARGLVRAIVKFGAQEVAQRAAGKDSLAGQLIGLAVGVAGAATEVADTRQWRTLPARVGLARVRLSEGEHTLRIQTNSGPKDFRFQISGTHSALAVRIIGDRAEMILGNKE